MCGKKKRSNPIHSTSRYGTVSLWALSDKNINSPPLMRPPKTWRRTSRKRLKPSAVCGTFRAISSIVAEAQRKQKENTGDVLWGRSLTYAITLNGLDLWATISFFLRDFPERWNVQTEPRGQRERTKCKIQHCLRQFNLLRDSRVPEQETKVTDLVS
jgi:hypothetical protein